MQISGRGLALLKDLEGVRHTAYKDVVGLLSTAHRKYPGLLLPAPVALLALLVLLAACSQPSVPVSGAPITDEVFVAATTIVHGIEVANVAIGDFLLLRHRAACMGKSEAAQHAELKCVNATAELKTYATQYAPKILTALLGVRDILRTVASRPTGTTQATLQHALDHLATVFGGASAWAQTQGWQLTTL